MPYIPKSATSDHEYYKGRHRFEHWYRDNQVYFITARCRNRHPAFQSASAKAIFWECFERYAKEHEFFPWVTSLLDNHYHTLGYLRVGLELQSFMRKFHGSVAKRVNDLLSVRLVPFWSESRNKGYFDGCIRDEKQCRLAYRYTQGQGQRHRVVSDWRDYPHTRTLIELEVGLKRALELNAFLERVPYKRYHHPPQGH